MRPISCKVNMGKEGTSTNHYVEGVIIAIHHTSAGAVFEVVVPSGRPNSYKILPFERFDLEMNDGEFRQLMKRALTHG